MLLGFPPLDRLLDVIQNPPTTRQQQQYHTTWSITLQEPHQAVAISREPKVPPVVEITGATACSGKTQLLYHLISLCLLPPAYHHILNFGRGNAVVLLDLSSKFSILHLQNVMQNHISIICSANLSALSDTEVCSLISDSLIHLHVLRPQSSSALQATLDYLPSYLLSQPASHISANRSLGLLAINDLSAFLWQDRLDADERAGGLSSAPRKLRANGSLFHQRYHSLVSSLRYIQHLFSCTILITNWGLAPITSVANRRALRPHLPSVWSHYCTLRILVQRDRVPKFRPSMSAEEAAIERRRRWEAVEQSGFTASVNWWGSEDWREEVKEGLTRLEGGGSFSFKIAATGIIVNDSKD